MITIHQLTEFNAETDTKTLKNGKIFTFCAAALVHDLLCLPLGYYCASGNTTSVISCLWITFTGDIWGNIVSFVDYIICLGHISPVGAKGLKIPTWNFLNIWIRLWKFPQVRYSFTCYIWHNRCSCFAAGHRTVIIPQGDVKYIAATLCKHRRWDLQSNICPIRHLTDGVWGICCVVSSHFDSVNFDAGIDFPTGIDVSIIVQNEVRRTETWSWKKKGWFFLMMLKLS